MLGILRKRGEIIFVGLMILAVAVANQWQVISPALHPKPDTVFLGVGHHYEDYFFYLSQYAQGARGAVLATNQFTPENIPQTMMWLTNVWLGKLGGLVGLTPWWSYSLSVFGLALIYLILIYKIMGRIFPESGVMRVGGFFLATLTTNFYGINIVGGQLTIQPFEFFYHYTAAFNRLGAVPHLILQNILSLILLLNLSDIWSQEARIKKQESRIMKLKIIRLVVYATWLFVINPVSLLIVWLTFGVVVLIVGTLRNTVSLRARVAFDATISEAILLKFVYMVCIITPATILLLIQLPALRHPFFQNFQAWETGVNPASLMEVIKSFGPFLILVILGLPVFLRKNDSLRITGAVYSILPLILYFSPIPKWLHVPYFRFLQPAAYVFFGAMAMEGIRQIVSLRAQPAAGRGNPVINKIASLLPSATGFARNDIQEYAIDNTRLRKNFHKLLFLSLLILFLVFQLPMLYTEINGRLNNFIIPSPLNYVPVELVKGLQELEKYPAGNVLATNTLELLVPTFSGKTVYSAHRSLTIDYYRKIEEIARFYHLQMTLEEGRSFLAGNNLTYVLWHTTDGDPQLLENHYSFLKKEYQNPQFILYRLLIDNTD